VTVRADAALNRARILDAARALVVEVGVEVPMDEIARRAGVAVGTLYRHFRDKDDLVAAVVGASVARMADLTETALAEVHAGASPGPVLERVFRVVAEGYATDRMVKEAAGRLPGAAAISAELATAVPGTAEHRAASAIDGLLDAARAAGQVRPDVDVADLVVLLAGVPDPVLGAERRARYVDVVLAGVRAPS
jgi:AcrR family transcriptional regulator